MPVPLRLPIGDKEQTLHEFPRESRLGWCRFFLPLALWLWNRVYEAEINEEYIVEGLDLLYVFQFLTALK